MKLKIITIVIQVITFSICVSSSFGESEYIQREPGAEVIQGEKVAEQKVDNNIMNSKSLRIKTDSKVEDRARFSNEPMNKYKMPAEGEGDKK